MAVDMNVNNNVGNGTPQTQQKSKTSVDYQSFLKLLMAQMKNQDPTKPMDSTSTSRSLRSSRRSSSRCR